MILHQDRFRFATVLALLLAAVTTTWAQRALTILDVDSTQFPTIRCRFFAFDQSGSRLDTPDISAPSILENGTPCPVLSVSCPHGEPTPISAVLAFDVSQSMRENSKLDLAKTAADTWINAMPLATAECAVTSFNLQNQLSQNFTNNAAMLRGALATLAPQGAADFDAALINPPDGAVSIAARGRFKRIVLLITDGNAPGTESLILSQCLQNNVAVYTVTLGAPCPLLLKDLSERTGGGWFENVTTAQQARIIFLRILQEAQNIPPCEIVWSSAPGCNNQRTVEIDFDRGALSAVTQYSAPLSSKIDLISAPSELDFGFLIPGNDRLLPVTITARNGDITINSIAIDNIHFSLSPTPTLPLHVRRDSSITLMLRFYATDSSYVHGTLQFAGSGCDPLSIPMAGGVLGHGSPTLRIVSPAGGEIYKCGSAVTIIWSGILPTERVRLEYSTDASTNWKTITSDATGLQYRWQVPSTPSTACLVRAYAIIPGSIAPLTTFRNNHTAGILAADISPDSKEIITASSDGTARVWDIGTASTIMTLSGHAGPVRSVAYSPDGQWMVTGGDDGTTYTLASDNGALARVLNGHAGGVLAVCFSPDSKTIATAGADNTIKFWAVGNGLLLRTIEGHEGPVTDISFSPDGKKIVTSSLDQTVRIWNVADGLLFRVFRGHTAAVRSACFNSDGTTIASASDDGTARIWDIASGEVIHTFDGHGKPVRKIRYSPDGQWIATAGDDDLATIWDPGTGNSMRVLKGHTGAIQGLVFSPNGKFIVTGSSDTTARIWQLDTLSENTATSAHTFTITSPDLSGPDTLDFGEVVIGTKADLITPYLGNRSQIPIAVSDIQPTGNDRINFSIISGFPPFSLNAGRSQNIGMRFCPTSVGRKISTMEIITEQGTLFRVVRGVGIRPEIKAHDTIFSSMRCGYSSDTTLVIGNHGTDPLIIDNVLISGSGSSEFVVLGSDRGLLSLPITIQPGEQDSIVVEFSPETAGLHTALLTLYSNSTIDGPLTVALTGTKDSIGFTLSSSIVDFGTTVPDSSVTRTTTITNTGTADLFWQTPVQIGPYTIESIIPPIITSGSAAVATMRYTPRSNRERCDTLYELADPVCGHGTTLILKGASELVASVTLQAPEITAAPGERVEIPIMMRNPWKLINSRTTEITLLISFDASLLIPIEGTPQGMLTGAGRSIRIDAMLPANQDSTLIRIPFMAALGGRTSTPITIDTAMANGDNVKIFTTAGSFTLSNLCESSDIRLLRQGEFALEAAQPNPIHNSGRVKFSLCESGLTRLWLTDPSGREIKVLAEGDMAPGTYEATLDASTLSSGIYYCLLRTPTDQRIQRIIVSK